MNNSEDDFLPYEMDDINHPSLMPNLREINEFPETKAKCLEILRSELKSLQDIEHNLEESFLLRFLRVSKFDTSKALQRIIKYYQQQEILLDSFKKISLPLHKARSVNHAWFSPYRLKNNTSLLFALGGKVDYSKITFAERLYLDILAINGAYSNTVNQITGITALFDYKGFSIHSFLAHTPGWTRIFVETFMNAYPVRIKAVHVVNAPTLFMTVFKIAKPFLSKKIQERIFLHPNDSWKSLHSAIPAEVLLEEYGGKLKFDSCINLLEDIEELEDNFHKILKFGYIKTKESRLSFRPLYKKNRNITHHEKGIQG